jgi:hypothetical protein
VRLALSISDAGRAAPLPPPPRLLRAWPRPLPLPLLLLASAVQNHAASRQPFRIDENGRFPISLCFECLSAVAMFVWQLQMFDDMERLTFEIRKVVVYLQLPRIPTVSLFRQLIEQGRGRDNQTAQNLLDPCTQWDSQPAFIWIPAETVTRCDSCYDGDGCGWRHPMLHGSEHGNSARNAETER